MYVRPAEVDQVTVLRLSWLGREGELTPQHLAVVEIRVTSSS